MLEHMKKHPIKVKHSARRNLNNRKINFGHTILSVSCPLLNASRIKSYLEKNGCVYIDDGPEFIDAKGLYAERTTANMLIGARGKEGITQLQLSELTGIPRRHISDMENGRRPIGKQNSLKLAKALNVSYRIFL